MPNKALKPNRNGYAAAVGLLPQLGSTNSRRFSHRSGCANNRAAG